jgi:hypothetical protein
VGCADVDPGMSWMHNRLIQLFGGTVCMLHAIRVNHTKIRCSGPVVSEWYQQRHSSFTILLTRARIRSTLSTPPTDHLILDH